MTNRMRNLGPQPKDVNVLWIYMNGSDEDDADIRNNDVNVLWLLERSSWSLKNMLITC